MRFDLVDRVVEQSPDRIVTLKNITAAEEYLQDHFPTFPVLPGVMMLEAMVQAARRLISADDASRSRWVLGGVRGVKYGAFVRPGETLRVEVTLKAPPEPGAEEIECKGVASVADPSGGEARQAVSGRFTLRPLRVGAGM